MIHFKRTDASAPEFVELVALLDADLAERDGADHAFYAVYNTIEQLEHVIVAFHEERPVACGALKPYGNEQMEVKRMYTVPEYRGRGLASELLAALEEWARSLGMTSCVLETGLRQPESLALYRKSGYHPIPNYGQYVGVANSRCFKKDL